MTSGYIHKNDIATTNPPFIASIEGLVQRTQQINKPTGATPDENGKVIVKGGSLFKNGSEAVGIVYEDVDVTYGEKLGSVVEAGRVWIDRLDATVFTTAIREELTAKGLFFDKRPEIKRP